METSIRIGDTIYSVGSDEELAKLKEAVGLLEKARALQKVQRSTDASEIQHLIATFVENYGAIFIDNATAKIMIDASNVVKILVEWDD